MISGITLFTNSSIHLFLIFIVMKLLQIEKWKFLKHKPQITLLLVLTLHSYLSRSELSF